MSAIRNCECCGKPVTAYWAWCSACLVEMGVEGLPYRAWPVDVRQQYQMDDTMQKRRLRDLGREEQDSLEYDRVCYGELNDDGDTGGIFEVASVYEGWDTSGGTITCCDCGREFSDAWPTFPLPSHRWIVPTCPECGSGRLMSEA